MRVCAGRKFANRREEYACVVFWGRGVSGGDLAK